MHAVAIPTLWQDIADRGLIVSLLLAYFSLMHNSYLQLAAGKSFRLSFPFPNLGLDACQFMISFELMYGCLNTMF